MTLCLVGFPRIGSFSISTLHQFSLISLRFGYTMTTSHSQAELSDIKNKFTILVCLLVLVLINRNIISSLIRSGPKMGTSIEIIKMFIFVSIGIILGTSGFGFKSKKQNDFSFNLDADESQDSMKNNPNLDRYSTSEQFIIEFLLEKENKCWQSDIVKNSDLTKSKISRTLSSLESKGLITRVRDGIGNRVILNESEFI